MKKHKLSEIMKVAAASVLSIGVFSMAFMGINSVALAAATNGTQSIPSAVETVNIPDNLPPENFQSPAITVLEETNEANNVERNAHALTSEEAAEIGAQYIWEVFGESIDNTTIIMTYSNWQGMTRTYWQGVVMSNSGAELLDNKDLLSGLVYHRFEMIDVNSGEVIDMSERSYISRETGYVTVRFVTSGEDAEISSRHISVRNVIADAVSGEEIDAGERVFAFMIDAGTGERIDVRREWGTNSRNFTEEDMEEAMAIREIMSREFMAGNYHPYTLSEEIKQFEMCEQVVKEYAQRHFNNSTVVSIELESVWPSGLTIDGDGNLIATDKTLAFNVTDDTGRVASVSVHAKSNQIMGITTQHNDIIPGFFDNMRGRG